VQPLGSGQAVRRLTLDQETEGSNPSAPANTTTSGIEPCARPPDVAVSTSLGTVAEEVDRWQLRLTLSRFVRLTLRAEIALRLIQRLTVCQAMIRSP
jgi:hypothetical protein